jgi:hypothetical protein
MGELEKRETPEEVEEGPKRSGKQLFRRPGNNDKNFEENVTLVLGVW